MKMLQIGAGMIGGIIAKDLASENTITVFDGDAEKLSNLKSKIPSLKCVNGSVGDKTTLKNLLDTHDIISIALPGNLALDTVREAMLRGKVIFDISSVPNTVILNEFQNLASKTNATYIPKIGIAPGMTNFLVGRGTSDLDVVKDVKIYVGGIPSKRVSPMDYKTVFCLEETLQEYVDPAAVIRDGRLVYVPALSELHDVTFEDFHELEAFITDGLATLSQTITAENMAEYTIRWSGHADKIKNLVALGLFNDKKVKFNGNQEISHKDYLISILTPLWKMDFKGGDRDVTLFRIIVTGEKNDENIEYSWELIDYFDEEKNITSMGKCTGFTCAAFIRAFMNKLIPNKGIVYPEKLSSNDTLYDFIMKQMSFKGVHFKETKIHSKKF